MLKLCPRPEWALKLIFVVLYHYFQSNKKTKSNIKITGYCSSTLSRFSTAFYRTIATGAKTISYYTSSCELPHPFSPNISVAGPRVLFYFLLQCAVENKSRSNRKMTKIAFSYSIMDLVGILKR